MAVLKNTVILGDEQITGNLNVNGNITKNGEIVQPNIKITLCSIKNMDTTEVNVFLGIPESINIDFSKYSLEYVRFCKNIKYLNNPHKIFHSKWHKIKYPINYMQSECPNWVNTYPDSIIVFSTNNQNPEFYNLGYAYYKLYAYYVEDGNITYTDIINNYINMEYENTGEGLPYKFTNPPTRDLEYEYRYYKTAGRLMHHNKCGLCLMNKNGEIVSNIALLRTTYRGHGDLYNITLKNN